MPTTNAGRQYMANLNFFAGLRNKTGKFQLEFNKEKGLFSTYSGTGFTRTFSNILSSRNEQQSIKNDAMFANPIKDVFMEGILNGVDKNMLKQALDGIVKVSKAYNDDQSKSKKFDELIYDIRSLTGINVTNNLSSELYEEFKKIDPKTVLSNEDIDFIDNKILKDIEVITKITQTALDKHHALDEKPYAEIADSIYRRYNQVGGYMQPQITDMQSWVNSLPKIKNKKGMEGLQLQHNEKFLTGNFGLIVENLGYGKDFIYYSIGVERPETVWRIYLNFLPEYAAEILNYLLQKNNFYHIHSFKIAGPLAFEHRVDKVVVYIYGKGQATNLAKDLHDEIGIKGAFTDPVPAMTNRQFSGISIGVEPEEVETGFSHEVNPTKARRQSYGGLRAQLIAAALVHFCDNAEYTKRNFPIGQAECLKRWVAIAFKSYRNYLQPGI